MMRASEVLTEHFHGKLVEIMQLSNQGNDYREHGFVVWKENGEYKSTDIFVGSETNVNLEKKYEKKENIIVYTRPPWTDSFSLSDICYASPYSDDLRGTTSGVAILVGGGSIAELRCLERTSEGEKAGGNIQLEIAEEIEEIEQRHYLGSLSEEDAYEEILENLSPYAEVSTCCLDIGSFDIQLPV